MGHSDEMTAAGIGARAINGGVSMRAIACLSARRRVVLALLASLLFCLPGRQSSAQSGVAPRPPIRPPELSRPPPLPPAPPVPQPTNAPHLVVGAQGQSGVACLAALTASGVKAEAAPAPPAPLPDCGIAVPVRLAAIALATGTSLDLPERPIVDCAFAQIFTDYARNLIAPLGASMLGSRANSILTGPGYECRGRNRVNGARTSAHGRGNAIDLTSITLADGRKIAIESQKDATETAFIRVMRTAACGWFTTVLGPGSDAAHATNMHLDIERHGSSDRYRICD
jgi:hypothetical protein